VPIVVSARGTTSGIASSASEIPVTSSVATSTSLKAIATSAVELRAITLDVSLLLADEAASFL